MGLEVSGWGKFVIICDNYPRYLPFQIRIYSRAYPTDKCVD